MHLVQRSEGVGLQPEIKAILNQFKYSAWSWRFERHGQWHDLPDPAAAQCPQKVDPRMRDRNRKNTTNARTPLNKFLQASSNIRYIASCIIFVKFKLIRSKIILSIFVQNQHGRINYARKIICSNFFWLVVSYLSPIILWLSSVKLD